MGTLKRFAGLMVQLLHKLSIRAANGPHKLLKVIKNPIVDHLPPNARITLLSVTGRLVSVPKFIPSLPDDVTHVYVAGALAHGKAEAPYADECIDLTVPAERRRGSRQAVQRLREPAGHLVASHRHGL